MATDATVDITTASRTLGLSVEALRKRLQRGAARGYKANDGTWRVFLDDPTDNEPGPDNAANGNGGKSPGVGGPSTGSAGLAAEVSALREDVRILKSHLGDLRRALEETVSGHTSGPAVPSLASPARDDGPVLEQPAIASGDGQSANVDTDIPAPPDFGDAAPWIDADTAGWDMDEVGDEVGDEAGDGAKNETDGVASGDDPFAIGSIRPSQPMADPMANGLDEAQIRRLIEDSVDEKLKPALEVLREALLAMRKSR